MPLFSRFLRFAHKNTRLAVKDTPAGFAASHVQLLTDVLHLQASLEESTMARLDGGEEVFINILGPGGYEFTVALRLRQLGQ